MSDYFLYPLAVKQVEPTLGLEQSSEDDDHASDYFADAESCSCGSSDCDTDWSDTVENIGTSVCFISITFKKLYEPSRRNGHRPKQFKASCTYLLEFSSVHVIVDVLQILSNKTTTALLYHEFIGTCQ